MGSSPIQTTTGVDNTQVGSSSKQDFNISPQTMTVSYVSQQDRTMMEGIQQMLNHLNGGNVTITDAMVNEVLSRIRKENIDKNGDNALELQRIKKIELEKELYEAESLELGELMAEIDEQYEIKYSELNDEMNTLLKNASNDDQRAKIIADYDQLRNQLRDEHNNERAKRLEELKRRLAEKRMEKVNQFNDENKLILANYELNQTPMSIDNALDSLKATTDDIDSGITGDKIEMIELEIQDIKASFEKEKNRIKAEFDNIVQSKLDSDVYNTLQIELESELENISKKFERELNEGVDSIEIDVAKRGKKELKK